MTDFPALAQYDMDADYSLTPVSTNGDIVKTAFDIIVQNSHANSYNRGWWHDPITGVCLIPGDTMAFFDRAIGTGGDHVEVMPLIRAMFPFVVAAKLNLIHDETSEGSEAFRTSKMDDKITHFAGITAEMADVVIRVADLMGMLKAAAEAGVLIDLGPEGYRNVEAFDLGLAYLAKSPYNAGRADHSLAKRREEWGLGGKLY